jgi:hypothetical protein
MRVKILARNNSSYRLFRLSLISRNFFFEPIDVTDNTVIIRVSISITLYIGELIRSLRLYSAIE